MKLAIIDVGTNSSKLLVVEVDKNKKIRIIHKNKISVKLGEGGITHKQITQPAFERGLSALIEQKQIIDTFNVEKILAFGTSAIRDAKNGALFLSMVKEHAQIDIQMISGDKEAELIYYGVKSSVEFSEQKVVIMDIGGGSTEFIICNNATIFWKKSYKLGASRLLEIIKPSDPITKNQKYFFNDYVSEILKDLVEQLKYYKVEKLIGSSGTFDSLAEIAMADKDHRLKKNLELKDGYLFDLEDLERTSKKLIKSTFEERLQIKGLALMRAEMIVMSSMLIRFVLKHSNIETIQLSKSSLKEGMLLDFIHNTTFNSNISY